MLILNRRPGESLIIGRKGDVLTQDIVVTVLGLKPNEARIGVSAQKNIPVDREEIHERKFGLRQP